MLNFAANAIGGYNLTRSLRFRRSAGGYLNRTFGSGNQQIMTLSFWFKRGQLGVAQYLFGSYSSGSAFSNLYIESTDQIGFADAASATNLLSTQVFRDPSAWYHIVVAIDTTQATAANRVKFYVNGVQITAFAASTYPAQNTNLNLNSATNHTLFNSAASGATNYTDGYLTEVNFIDGQALTPSSFGSYNSVSGVWQPAPYTGTYGTNGFYLPFTDNSALTTSSNAGLGKDFSGNGNYWTTNNISITSGTTYDSMTDVPTLTSATAANFAVLNPLTPSFADTGSASITNGNLTVTGNNGYGFSSVAPSSSKWYFEVVNTSANVSIGIWLPPFTHSSNGYNNTNYRWFGVDGVVYNQAGTTFQSYNTYGNGDVIGVALDLVNGKLYFSKNNTWQGSSDPVAGTNAAISGLSVGWLFGVISNSANVANVNFGQRPFTYTPPTGFVALNTYNLPTSTIVKGDTAMNIALASGASIKTTTEALFSGQFLEWIKDRANANNHQLLDGVRGLSAVLQSNSTGAETTYLAPSGNSVGWAWKAGGTTSTNTSGTITSTVSVNASAGFSIVTYTGTAVNATVGHGLGVAPKMIIAKIRNAAGDWLVGNSNLPSWNNLILLNGTNGYVTDAAVFNGTAPTSSVFSIGTNGQINSAGYNYVAYCWTPIAGYSSFGSYTGNGSTDGPFVYTGFRPKFVISKRTNASGDWNITDGARDPYNAVANYLFADLSDAENSQGSGSQCDYLSNGFKWRNSGGHNASGSTYIYMAFAESPFRNALAR